MRITSYRTELDENKHNVLVKEKSCNYPIDILNSAEKISTMLNDIYNLNKQSEEYVYMIALNTKCKPLGVFEISHGTVNNSIFSPREIFIKALLCSASFIILAHNHPSGDTTPSEDDMKECRRVKDVGEMIGVPVLDNIIVGDDYYSFEENNLL